MIAVLSPDVATAVLDALRAGLEARDWRCEVSRGRTQTVLTVAGPESTEELEAALAPHVVADVLPVLSSEQYAARRRWRRVMHVVAWGLWILIGFGLGIPAVAFVRSPVDELVGPEVVRGTTLERMPENSGRHVRLGRAVVLLVRLDGERFFALSALCTHMDECQLLWSSERQQIVCPCHGCAYDLYGNVVSGPPSVPLASFDVQVLENDVFVHRSHGG